MNAQKIRFDSSLQKKTPEFIREIQSMVERSIARDTGVLALLISQVIQGDIW